MAVTSLPAGFDWWLGGPLGDAHLGVARQLPQCKQGHAFLKAEVIRELIVRKGVEAGRKGIRTLTLTILVVNSAPASIGRRLLKNLWAVSF
jgi:hypothetical protein